MTFQDAVKSGIHQWMTFEGRSSRSEYWYWMLFVTLVSMALSAVGATLDSGSLLDGLIVLFFFLAHLSVAIRRLHDLDKSGWWVLLSFVPFIGGVILFIWFVTKGTDGLNQYGPDPLVV